MSNHTFKAGDFVSVVDPDCRKARIEDGQPVSGTVERIEQWSSGTVYVVSRSCGQTWGCNAEALAVVSPTEFRWRRKS
jgi:hypothetical protein